MNYVEIGAKNRLAALATYTWSSSLIEPDNPGFPVVRHRLRPERAVLMEV